MQGREIIHGIRIGRHEFHPEEVMDFIKRDVIGYGLNFLRFSLLGTEVEDHYFREWAKFLADNKIYFAFEGSTKENMGLTKEIAVEMKKIAGKYYMFNLCHGELGHSVTCNAVGLGPKNDSDDLTNGKLMLENALQSAIDKVHLDDSIPTVSIEATPLISHIAQKSAFPLLETLPGDPEISISVTRGTANAVGSERWGTYIAHEWYAGPRNLDPLKKKRLSLAYNYSYLSGSNFFVLESGNEDVCSNDTYKDKRLDYDHELCQNYRNFLKEFSDFVKKDNRPEGNPTVKFAFVQGNLDGFSPSRSSAFLWNRHENEDFAYNNPEYMWKIFNDIQTKRPWCDMHNFGDNDLSGSAAYGLFDIIPATASYEVMSKYDYLVFTGWNSMTEEIYENLKKFVTNGGKLFMTAAHLNTSTKRNGEIKLIHDGKVADLFGCDIDAENAFRVNRTYVFRDSIVPNVLFPYCMDWYSEGYLKYAKISNKTAYETGKLCKIARLEYTQEQLDDMPPWLIENKTGNGYAMLMTCLEYPGRSGFSAYREVVRELMCACHREADVKVYGGDRLRFSVYKDKRIYLLNTDFDCKTAAIVDNGKEKREYILEPCELKSIEY